MPDNRQPQNPPIKDAATHPEAGSGLRDAEQRSLETQRPAARDDEERSFEALDRMGGERDKELEGAMGGGGDGGDPAARQAASEISADDAGATAMAEAAGKRQAVPEARQDGRKVPEQEQ